jgi:predicted ribonuclease YlaK
VLPRRVVEELDQKKYTARDDLADRTRRLLSQLPTQLVPTKGGPAPLRDGVTIEIPVDDEPRARTLDGDQEVLDTCRELRSCGQRFVLVTGDTGMTMRRGPKTPKWWRCLTGTAVASWPPRSHLRLESVVFGDAMIDL